MVWWAYWIVGKHQHHGRGWILSVDDGVQWSPLIVIEQVSEPSFVVLGIGDFVWCPHNRRAGRDRLWLLFLWKGLATNGALPCCSIKVVLRVKYMFASLCIANHHQWIGWSLLKQRQLGQSSIDDSMREYMTYRWESGARRVKQLRIR